MSTDRNWWVSSSEVNDVCHNWATPAKCAATVPKSFYWDNEHMTEALSTTRPHGLDGVSAMGKEPAAGPKELW